MVGATVLPQTLRSLPILGLLVMATAIVAYCCPQYSSDRWLANDSGSQTDSSGSALQLLYRLRDPDPPAQIKQL